MNDDFIDMHELYGDDLPAVMKRYIERGYKSILAVPIIYITESSSSVPFAYIQLISKSKNFSLDDVLILKDHSFKLIDRIRDANTHLIPMHQRVIDISRGGAKLKITEKNLQKYIMRSKGFIFDLVFKLQAPITIFGEVKVSYTDEDENLMVGVDFEGNSSRKDEMKRYYSILKPMETDYKAKLLKSMKSRKKEAPALPSPSSNIRLLLFFQFFRDFRVGFSRVTGHDAVAVPVCRWIARDMFRAPARTWPSSGAKFSRNTAFFQRARPLCIFRVPFPMRCVVRDRSTPSIRRSMA